MNPFTEIKKHFYPIQPGVASGAGDILYEEIQPANPLQDYIYCYWQLQTKAPLPKPFSYRVVSDGCIDILFNHKKITESFVVGFYRKYTSFEIGTDFHYIGIRFYPAAFTHIFGKDAKTISNSDQWLKDVLPDLANQMECNIQQDQTFLSVAAQLNAMLGQGILPASPQFDMRFYDALLLILRQHGNIETETALNTGCSPRQLRRLFNYYIGTTPKAFSQIVRFQHILNAKPSPISLKDNKLYFDAGFYDQAHFIKDFKRFYGVTPAQAFR